MVEFVLRVGFLMSATIKLYEMLICTRVFDFNPHCKECIENTLSILRTELGWPSWPFLVAKDSSPVSTMLLRLHPHVTSKVNNLLCPHLIDEGACSYETYSSSLPNSFNIGHPVVMGMRTHFLNHWISFGIF